MASVGGLVGAAATRHVAANMENSEVVNLTILIVVVEKLDVRVARFERCVGISGE